MFDLNFEILSAEPLLYAAVPQLIFKLRVAEPHAKTLVQNVALRCQIQIEAAQRHYNGDEQKKLRDLFDEPSRWSQTLKTMLWTHVNVNVSSFTNDITIDVPVECSFDFNVAATKYFAALEEDDIPLLFQFSGTVFYADEAGALQIAQIPWSKESKFRLPAPVWRQMMDVYYPNGAWLRLRRDAFERLYEFKVKHGIPTWEQALEKLLNGSESRL